MSNFFEQELRKLFGDGAVIEAPRFTGRACLGTLGKDLRVRAKFVTSGYADHYDTLKITVLNRTDGPVDVLTLKLKDLLGVKPVPNNPNFPHGVAPYIWDYNGELEWYAYHPTQGDYKTIRQAVEQYLCVFRDRSQERAPEYTQGGPKLVYICAPLRGDTAKNIEFARQKAQEVFQAGDIPVCPHLMFPPIADSENPVQDQAAREMGLRLVESCQQVNVYGTEWTEGMWAEIRRAIDLGIEVKTDQKTIGRSQPQQKKNGRNQHER
jgi:hypothetical protein